MAKIKTKLKTSLQPKNSRKMTRITKISSKCKSSPLSIKKRAVLSKKRLLSSVAIKNRFFSSEEYIPVQRPQLRKSVNVEDSSLPDLSDKTRLRLMARDPNWIHVYWQIAPTTIETAQKDLGKSFNNARYVLRMHDVTCVEFNGRNANRTFDIEVNPKIQNWCVDSWQDNVSYCAQLGLSTDRGEFYPLAESNFVHTPRLSFSDRRDLMWLDVAPGTQKLPFILAGKSFVRKSTGQRRRYLTEDDIRAYYSRLFPVLRRILRKRLTTKRHGKKIRIGDVEFYDDDLLMSLTGNNKWFRKTFLGASEEMIEAGDVRGAGVGASESLTSMGGASEQTLKSRKFFFELGTELIVYGRTEPDAQVWHGNKQIPLRPDGTFSLRFALPDNGFIPLDFKAISHDQLELRKILTSGQRSKTNYETKLF